MEEIKDGIINVFKPKNYTSHDVVSIIKKMVGKKKVGHTGTLDPLAQGVLPILIGKGTQCAKYFNNHDKSYQVELALGKRTTTLDEEGEVIEEREVPKELLKPQIIEAALQQFIGKIEQTPPIYSAIKVKGKKLYEYARSGQTVEIPTREIIIYHIELKKVDEKAKLIIFEVECSKGTYIRTLCEDIAKKLGTIGYMKNLIRLKVGNFDYKTAIPLKELQEDINKISQHMIPIEKMFQNIPSIVLNEKTVPLFLNGVQLNNQNPDGVYRIYQNEKFIGTRHDSQKTIKTRYNFIDNLIY